MAVLTASGITRAHGAHVVLDGVSLTVGPGSRVGVVGPNGVGKSTLLRVMAGLERADAGRLTLAPPTLTVGYLAQEPTLAEATRGQEPTLGEATRGQEPTLDAATSKHETLFASLARRTGVAAAEADLERTAVALAEAAPGADDDYVAALDRYLALGGPDLRARAGAVCDDLGLPVDRLDVGMGVLSGGEAARAALAAILLSRFDILLLDEPTNDLDFAGLDRLERFVSEAPGGLVIVSHDRAFLERTIATVVELDEHSHTAMTYGGGWAAYLDAKATARRHAEEAHSGYVRRRESLQERARDQRQWAVAGARNLKKRPDDHDKAQKGFFLNRTEKQAAKVRITEKALERLEPVEKPWEGWALDLAIAEAPRSGQVVARLDRVEVQRGSFRLGPIDLEVAWRERIAILGPNGSGKTTLLRALLGQLPLAAGERYLGPSVVVGELDQARRRFLGGRPMLDAFVDASGLLPRESRSLLAKFGLTAEHVRRPAESLSPGERTRSELALLMARGVNCLVLDEPTNHLDLPAIEQLESALERYDGTLLLVTHDRRLLETVRIDRTVDLG